MDQDTVLDYPSRPPPHLVGQPSALTARQVAALACRVIALWMFAGTGEEAITVVYELVIAAGTFGGRGQWVRVATGPAMGLLVVAGPIAVGTLLWLCADRLAARMVPDGDATWPAGGLGYQGLLSVGLTVAGAIVLSPAVRSLAGAVAAMTQSHGQFADCWHDPYWTRQFWSSMAGLATAAWLLFGGRGIANLVVWALTAGRPDDRSV